MAAALNSEKLRSLEEILNKDYLKQSKKFRINIKSKKEVIRIRGNDDGYYFLNIQYGNEGHGIILMKKGDDVFVFDPSGLHNIENSFNPKEKGNYNFELIINGKNVEPYVDYVPENSWNWGPYCALWGMIFVIMMKEFNDEDIQTIRDKLNKRRKIGKKKKYMKCKAVGWIREIYKRLIRNSRKTYSSKSEMKSFVDEIKMELNKLVKPTKENSYISDNENEDYEY